MRIRSVKPDFWRDRDTTGRWPADMKLLYVGLWSVADDEGRFEMDPDLLAADLDPFRVVWADMPSVLDRIEDAGCLGVYEVGGKNYGFIPKFKEHQHPNKPVPSRLPAPPSPLPERARRTTVALRPVVEGRVEEREGSVRGGSKSAPAAPSPLTPPAGSVFKSTQAALVATFLEVKRAKYLWQGAKDSDGLKRILSLGVPLAEIQARWRSGLRASGWQSVKNVAQLASKWNDMEVDPHDALYARLRIEAERELAGETGGGVTGGGRADPQVDPRGGTTPTARAVVPAAVGELLGPGWQAGFVQNGAALEPGPQRRGVEAADPVRVPGNDAGGNGVAGPRQVLGAHPAQDPGRHGG